MAIETTPVLRSITPYMVYGHLFSWDCSMDWTAIVDLGQDYRFQILGVSSSGDKERLEWWITDPLVGMVAFNNELNISYVDNLKSWTWTIRVARFQYNSNSENYEVVEFGPWSNPLTTGTPAVPEEPPAAGTLENLTLHFDNTTFPNVELISVEWTHSGGFAAIAVESRIDNGDWILVITLTDPALTRQDLRLPEPTAHWEHAGVLDAAYGYALSDGQLHTVEIRAKLGNGNYLYTPTQILHLGNYDTNNAAWIPSTRYASLTTGRLNVEEAGEYDAPLIQVSLPGNRDHAECWATVDGIDYLCKTWDVNATASRPIFNERIDWLAGIPHSRKDGQNHTVSFRFVAYDSASVVLVENRSGPYVWHIPTVDELNPFTQIDIFPHGTTTAYNTDTVWVCNIALYLSDIPERISIDSTIWIDGLLNDDGYRSDLPQDATSRVLSYTHLPIPEDGLHHAVLIQLDAADPVSGKSWQTVYKVAPARSPTIKPPEPTIVHAELLRQADGPLPDQVRLSWSSNHLVQILLMTDKQVVLGYADSTENQVIIENTRNRLHRNGQLTPVCFGVVGYQFPANLTGVVFSESLSIQAFAPIAVPQTPDEITKSAETLSQAQFITALDTALANVDAAVITQVLAETVQKIKDVMSKGGHVELDNLGRFAAQWTPEKTTFRNGQYVVLPGQRNAVFIPSIGFTKGTRSGLVLTDSAATSV